MAVSDPWSDISIDALRSHSEALADAEIASELSEEAAREAAALRHVSTTPTTIGFLCQIGETALLALALWGGARTWPKEAPLSALTALIAACALALLATMVARALGAYRVGALRRFGAGYGRVMAGFLGAVLCFAALMEAVGPANWARGLADSALVGAGALALARVLISATVDWCVGAGLTERRAVVVGGGPHAERLIRALEASSDNDIRICALFDDRDDERSPPLVAGARKLGGVAELIAFSRIAHVDMLIITLPPSAEARILKLLGRLWVLPVDIRLAAFSDDFSFRRRESGLIALSERKMRGMGALAKRALDVSVAACALVALSPVLALTALAVRLDSPGPAIFRQKRHGYNNREVEVWKFRSMRVEAADPTARRVVTKGDDRVTRVGRFIRKTSIDELPQLVNVLGGSLSLVGPRPHVVNAVSSQAQAFGEIVAGYSARHRTKPGITGWAQIHGLRGEIDQPDALRQRFEHDLYYIENWSIWLDILILLRTPLSLLRTEKAY
ncbi:exopolysaccharide biosynthesis polyprenyl glycosylphosphotransferase [Rubrimonas cliftonensis]|uniref:Undecaprenyl-phosphate glucose phosphotransferase n=1 Tax=Rubrimonas cliftonensis TaxID=89524 RepID=A0A1H3VPF9_9RHOB|nr:exopolysaccharide biosynthesis polyprenyl glycosylphosphotransferase [Rubrimonas cliftonensis]SDZ76660.1 Undecaprenyl-phosphate glucose phosphotransferase [Rubrimonas cliftonensis]